MGKHRFVPWFFGALALVAFGTAPAQAEKTFVYCSEGSPSTFNPQLATDGPTFIAAGNTIYDRLVAVERDGTKPVPGLAEKWDVKDGGKTYIFKLRKGVKFHKTEYFTPSRDFNADDVVFSFNRMLDKQNPFHKLGGGNYEYFQSLGLDKLIRSVTKVDDHTVRFELNEPSAPFLSSLAIPPMGVLSKEYADQLLAKGTPDKIDIDPVGTGPFVFQKYVKDTQIRFAAHPQYFRGKAALDKLIFVITTDPSVRTQKLKTGECDFITYPAPGDLANLEKAANVKVISKAGLNVGYLAMNTEKKPFDNLLVRQAVSHALNRKAYLEAVYLNLAELAKNPIPPTLWAYNNSVKDYEYNPEKAKELLKKAGFPNGFETELWTLPVSRPYNPGGKKMGEMMQADLAKVGIKVKLVTFDWPTYLKKSAAGEHVLLQLGWSADAGDPDNFLNVLLSCSAVKAGANYARWCEKEFNDLVVGATQVVDPKKRTRMYMKAQEVFKKDAPWVTIAHAREYRAMGKGVKGFVINSLTGDNFYGVDVDR